MKGFFFPESPKYSPRYSSKENKNTCLFLKVTFSPSFLIPNINSIISYFQPENWLKLRIMSFSKVWTVPVGKILCMKFKAAQSAWSTGKHMLTCCCFFFLLSFFFFFYKGSVTLDGLGWWMGRNCIFSNITGLA